MREMTVREANQNFSQVIVAAERGETIIITKNGTPVARIAPQTADGRIIEGLRLMNPFDAANVDAIAALWTV